MEASMAFLLANKLADNMLLGSVQVREEQAHQRQQ
jgi:hypothetical protein